MHNDFGEITAHQSHEQDEAAGDVLVLLRVM